MRDAPSYSIRTECEGKRPYRKKADAKAAARRNERQWGRMHAYRCGWCDAFHIGHKPGSTAPANVNGPSEVASFLGPDQPERS